MNQAQAAESRFWSGVPSNGTTVAHALTEAAELAAWAARAAEPSLLSGPWVDVGIGPLGLCPAHFLRSPSSPDVIGVDPLDHVRDPSAVVSEARRPSGRVVTWFSRATSSPWQES